MADPSPFLSAGLPGLTFALSLGRGLSIEIDPAAAGGVIAEDSEELNPPDEKSFIENTTLPNALLVIHFYAVHKLVVDSFAFEVAEKLFVYTTFAIGSTKKATQQHLYEDKNTSIIFNEVKYIPLDVTLTPNEHTNKLVVLVYACKEGDRFAVSPAEHKMIGRYEAHTHTLLKYVNGHETVNLLSKKGVTIGEIEFEFGVTYGSFGYGQSYQLKNDLYTPEDLTKLCMLPRVLPADDALMHRGTAMYPRKLKHPPFIPVFSEPVEDFEPDISVTKGPPPVECPVFPLVKQHMQRFNGLMDLYSAQTTRSKRICFLRKLLQDGVGNVDEAFEEGTESPPDKPAPIPAALAILMNTTRFIAHAPGIVRRRSKLERASLPNSQSNRATVSKPRSHSVTTSSDLEAMKNYMFSNRRQSLAPTKSQISD